ERLVDASAVATGRARPRGRGGSRSDRWFSLAVATAAAGSIVTLAALALLLLFDAWPSAVRYGVSFVTQSGWEPVFESFGALHFVYGTLVTSAVALLLAAPIGVGAALFVAEYAPRWLGDPVSFLVELLAVIPSIIYGLWGFFILAPLMRGGV